MTQEKAYNPYYSEGDFVQLSDDPPEEKDRLNDISEDTHFAIDAINEGWRTLKFNLCYFMCASFLLLLFVSLAIPLPFFLNQKSKVFIVFAVYIGIGCIGIIIYLFLTGMYSVVFRVNKDLGYTPKYSDLLDGFFVYWDIGLFIFLMEGILFGAIAGVMILIMFILDSLFENLAFYMNLGVYAVGTVVALISLTFLSFALLIGIDEKDTTGVSLQIFIKSKNIVYEHTGHVIMFSFFAALIIFLGAITIVGILIAVPLIMISQVQLYELIKGLV